MTDTMSLADEAADLFTEFRAGRVGSLDDLVRLLTPVLWHLARGCGLGATQSEDVVQTAWMKLVNNAGKIREDQAVLAWLGTTVRREAWKVRRESKRAADEQQIEDFAATSPGPAEALIATQSRRILWHHFKQLSPRCQALLRVISRGGPPDYAALSEALGIPVGSIGPTRGRCLATLRNALETDPSWSAS